MNSSTRYLGILIAMAATIAAGLTVIGGTSLDRSVFFLCLVITGATIALADRD